MNSAMTLPWQSSQTAGGTPTLNLTWTKDSDTIWGERFSNQNQTNFQKKIEKERKKKPHSGIGLLGLGNVKVGGEFIEVGAKIDGGSRRSKWSGIGSWRALREVKRGRKKAKVERFWGAFPPWKWSIGNWGRRRMREGKWRVLEKGWGEITSGDRH